MPLRDADSSGAGDLLAAGRLEHRFASLERSDGVLAAVSGGPDSIALMHLLARWRPAAPRPPILVGTVDHGLRPESAGEAAFVAGEAAALGLPHRTLAWTAPKPAAGLQEAARDARYDLLLGCARDAGATHLVTAHTLDDQAETVLMRLARGSGLAGLAGMRAERDRQGVRHVRPLLDCRKETLLGLCRQENWPYVTDPSNADDRFARVRWRRLMPALAAEGLTAERLAALARRMGRADAALDRKARDAFALAHPVFSEGGVCIDAAPLGEEPFEIAVRVLAQAVAAGGGAPDGIRLHRLEACVERLRTALQGAGGLRLTVAGALVDLDPGGRLSVGPEPPRRRGR